jgi:hypothetical protein
MWVVEGESGTFKNLLKEKKLWKDWTLNLSSLSNLRIQFILVYQLIMHTFNFLNVKYALYFISFFKREILIILKNLNMK